MPNKPVIFFPAGLVEDYINYLSCFCNKISPQKWPKRKRVYFDPQCGGVVCCGGDSQWQELEVASYTLRPLPVGKQSDE